MHLNRGISNALIKKEKKGKRKLLRRKMEREREPDGN
jgi:hypothetical protein